MDTLAEFAKHIEDRLTAARKEPKWEPARAERYMAEFRPRRERFERLGQNLLQTVVRPRLELLTRHFTNARLAKDEGTERCQAWFGYCEQFPASVKLEFAVEHDAAIDHLTLRYELHIMPSFAKYDAHDKVTFSLDVVDGQVVANWVEQKLLAFLDTYLELDRGRKDFADEIVTDPVCGMRIRRSTAAFQADHRGHPYFFCTEECRRRFTENPGRYVQVVTM